MIITTTKELNNIGSDWKHLLIKGDCLEAMNELVNLNIKTDLVLTDPPFGITQNKWDSVIPFDYMWEWINRIIKDNSAIAIFGVEPFSSALRMSNIKNYKYDWLWDKVCPTGHLNVKKRPMKKIENISIFSNKLHTYNPQGLVFNPRKKTRSSKSEGSSCYGKHGDVSYSEFSGYPTERLEFQNENGLHPTQKPVQLLEYLIRTYTNEGDTVLDFTMGSGSTGVACVNTNRKFIGIELDEKYFSIAENRINEAIEKSSCSSQ